MTLIVKTSLKRLKTFFKMESEYKLPTNIERQCSKEDTKHIEKGEIFPQENIFKT